VQSATRANQQQLITTLGQLPQALRDSGLGSPSIIIVGDVVRCANAYQSLPVSVAA
jgi:uroporphyrin-III C-methyltransferase